MEATLARYWSAHHGIIHRVTWQDGKFLSKHDNQREPQQRWYCNKWLNVVFTPRTETEAFDPIRREFSHSLSRWRQPIQKTYVTLATSPGISRFFTHMVMYVTPPVATNRHQIVVPGNHRIRVLDHRNRISTAILKDGFSDNQFLNEIRARQLAQKLQIPTPQILEVDEDVGWFSEDYVSGTPLNRIRQPDRIALAVQKVCKSLIPLFQESQQFEPFTDYVHRLLDSASDQIRSHRLLDTAKRVKLETCVTKLMDMINREPVGSADNAKPFCTAMAHGDLQPANILLDRDHFWLIDWEYSTRRQLGYDLLVLGLDARLAYGRVSRFQEFLQHGRLKYGVDPNHVIPKLDWSTVSARKRTLLTFMAEELRYGLDESSNVQFTQLGTGLNCLLDEFNSMIDVFRI